MSEEKKQNPFIIDEREVPESWKPIEADPVVPGHSAGAPPAQDHLPSYFRGTLAPSLQHDAQLVATDKNPRVPVYPLIPLPASASPQHNAAIQSLTNVTMVTTASPDNDPFLLFRGVWASSVSYNANDIVIWHGSSYVAITASTNSRPDQNPANWTLVSENLNFQWRPIILQTNFGSGGNGYTASFNKNVQAGSSIIVGVVSNGNVFTSASITDTQGNNFTLIKMSARLSAGGGFYWTAIYAANNAVGGPDTITTTFSGIGLGATDFTFIAEVNGPLIGNVDGTATAGALVNSGNSFPSMSLPVTNAGELVFTLLYALASTNGSAPNGYSSLFEPGTAALAIAWTQNSTPGTDTIQWGGTVSAGSFNVPISMVAASFFLPSDTFKPYDVVEFRGSAFVCLSETSLDAFTDPTKWALIGPGAGSVDILSGSYSAVATDTGRLLSFNSASAVTLTLPNPVPSPPAGVSETGFWIAVQNIGTGSLTLNNNGLTIDGVAGSLSLGQNQGLLIFADPTGSYETWHGMTSIVLPNAFVNGGVDGSGKVTITLANQTANTAWAGPTSGAAAAPSFRALVNADLPATIPTVPPELTVSGNVASPAGSLAISKANQAPNTFWAGPASGPPAQVTFRTLTAADIPSGAMPPLAVAVAIVAQETMTLSGNLRINGQIPPAGVYRVSAYFFLQANPSAGSLDVSITYDDGTASRTLSPAPISTAGLNVGVVQFTVVCDGVNDVNWVMTLT